MAKAFASTLGCRIPSSCSGFYHHVTADHDNEVVVVPDVNNCGPLCAPGCNIKLDALINQTLYSATKSGISFMFILY